MDKKGAKGYQILTARIINQELFDEYVNKVGPWLKDVRGEVFEKLQNHQVRKRLKFPIYPLFVNLLP